MGPFFVEVFSDATCFPVHLTSKDPHVIIQGAKITDCGVALLRARVDACRLHTSFPCGGRVPTRKAWTGSDDRLI